MFHAEGFFRGIISACASSGTSRCGKGSSTDHAREPLFANRRPELPISKIAHKYNNRIFRSCCAELVQRFRKSASDLLPHSGQALGVPATTAGWTAHPGKQMTAPPRRKVRRIYQHLCGACEVAASNPSCPVMSPVMPHLHRARLEHEARVFLREKKSQRPSCSCMGFALIFQATVGCRWYSTQNGRSMRAHVQVQS